jgi:H+-transporting ATPase
MSAPLTTIEPESQPKAGLADMPAADLQRQLGTSPAGLSQAEAQNRLARYGRNELADEKVNPLLKFVSYFWGPIPWMIEIAVILSAVVGHWADFAIILTLLVVNALVGFWEEYQAGNAIAALKKKLALRAKAMRDGAWRMVPAAELVPGDLIRLRIGDIVPADAKLLPGDPIEVDQSALTGESLPVSRQGGEIVYSGSIVRQGEIDALVYATGANTYFGKTAQLVQEAHTVSHFQRAVLKIGDFLIVVAIALVVLIVTVELFRHQDPMETIQFALVLTVAAIPVALPTVLSVTMSVGARILSKFQAIVSRLASIDELAGMDVLCSDKTGTLTQNKLTLGEPFLVGGVTAASVLKAAGLASRAEDQDPIDLAVLGNLKDDELLRGYEVRHFTPFDPVHKRTESKVLSPDKREFQVAKGAPQVILELAANKDQVRADVEKAVGDFAVRGFRALGVAQTDPQGRWQFLGILPLFDPPREDCKETLETARTMGVRVKMVTGDQMAIAKEISKQLGLGTDIINAQDISEARPHTAGQLADAIERSDGFAQVYPEHKYHIVDVLQQRGHVVGMTGDGVNDAPALKKADVGIAVSGATDAARAAADIVLLSPGLSVIIRAMQESRKIFQRMTNYAMYRIAETIRVLLFMTLSILIFNFYPVTAVMIVLLALLNDGAIISIAYDRVRYSSEPVVWKMSEILTMASILGLVGVTFSFGLFFLAKEVFHVSDATVQSLIYLKLSVAGQLTIYLTRTRGPFWSIRPGTALFCATGFAQLTATVITVYGVCMPALGWHWALAVWTYALTEFVITDVIKIGAYRLLDAKQPAVLNRRGGA